MVTRAAKRYGVLVVVVLLLGLAVVGCSGGSGTSSAGGQQFLGQDQQFLGQDTSELGGMEGNVLWAPENSSGSPAAPGGSLPGSGGSAPATGGFNNPYGAEGAYEDAPLGTNPEFQMEPISSDVTDISPSKEGSVIVIKPLLEPGEEFTIRDITMSLAGDQPDYSLVSATFYEGDFVTLWMQYEVTAGVVLDMNWFSAEIGLDLLEVNISHVSAGIYEVKLDYIIPYGTATGNAKYSTTLSNATGFAASDPFPYTILETPISPLLFYPGTNDESNTAGLIGGQFDIDTSSFISSIGDGSTDHHSHAYDDKHGVVGADFFNLLENKLHNITEDIPSGATKFKIIVANADLSRGGRLVINQVYDAGNPASYILAPDYDDGALSSLPIYSLDGVAGTTQLQQLGMYFDKNALAKRELHPTNTRGVRDNVLGKFGEWRNGSLTIQAVAVNDDGSDAFTTDTSMSSGGVQGVATSGLLWEATIFWDWKGPSYNKDDWATFGKDDLSHMGQMVWEDILDYPDYDYNDLVTSMHIAEYRNLSNELVQIVLTIKALARGSGYDGDWQLNMEASLPGANVIAVVDQYYDDGDGDYTNDVRHGQQRIWQSTNGTSPPIFAPTADPLPNPPGAVHTNTVPGTLFIEGDYAIATIMLDKPMPQGSYTPIPYDPDLRVTTATGEVYNVPMWSEPGDWVDANGRPLGIIVPDTYAWPLEYKEIATVYDGFNAWVVWINNQTLSEPDPAWFNESPVQNYFDRILFL